MSWLKKAWVKYLLATVGAIYIVVAIGYLVNLGYKRMQPAGASELAAHPERAGEIMAQQRLDEIKTQLGLSNEQAKQLADLFQQQNPMGRPPGGPGDEDFRARRDAFQSAIAQILTPEQIEKFREMRGGFAGPGGPGGPGGQRGGMSQERIESLRSHMSPEQQERFDRRVKEWEERRQRRPGGPGGGQRGMRGGPPNPGEAPPPPPPGAMGNP